MFASLISSSIRVEDRDDKAQRAAPREENSLLGVRPARLTCQDGILWVPSKVARMVRSKPLIRRGLYDQEVAMAEVEVLVELGEEHRILAALPVRVVEEIAVLVVVDDTVIGILRRLADDQG